MNKYDNENIIYISEPKNIIIYPQFKILISINFIIKMFNNVIYIINILLLLLKKVIE